MHFIAIFKIVKYFSLCPFNERGERDFLNMLWGVPIQFFYFFAFYTNRFTMQSKPVAINSFVFIFSDFALIYGYLIEYMYLQIQNLLMTQNIKIILQNLGGFDNDNFYSGVERRPLIKDFLYFWIFITMYVLNDIFSLPGAFKDVDSLLYYFSYTFPIVTNLFYIYVINEILLFISKMFRQNNEYLLHQNYSFFNLNSLVVLSKNHLVLIEFSKLVNTVFSKLLLGFLVISFWACVHITYMILRLVKTGKEEENVLMLFKWMALMVASLICICFFWQSVTNEVSFINSYILKKVSKNV